MLLVNLLGKVVPGVKLWHFIPSNFFAYFFQWDPILQKTYFDPSSYIVYMSKTTIIFYIICNYVIQLWFIFHLILWCRGRHASKLTEKEEDEEYLKEEEEEMAGGGGTRLLVQPSCKFLIYVLSTMTVWTDKILFLFLDGYLFRHPPPKTVHCFNILCLFLQNLD